MQRELIAEVEAAQPTFLLFVMIQYSWLQRPDSSELVLQWFQEYKKNYQRVGLVEIFPDSSRYSWQSEVRWPPASPYWVEILRKVETSGDPR
jgi:hypothetical protein